MYSVSFSWLRPCWQCPGSHIELKETDGVEKRLTLPIGCICPDHGGKKQGEGQIVYGGLIADSWAFMDARKGGGGGEGRPAGLRIKKTMMPSLSDFRIELFAMQASD